MCRSSLRRVLLNSCSNPSTPKSPSGSDVAEASSLGPASAVEDIKTDFDSDDWGVKAQSGISGGGASLDAQATGISLSFNPDSVHPDAFCVATASHQIHPLSPQSPFNTTSFLASCLFRPRESSLNHALLPIGSFLHQPQSNPPPGLIVSPVRQSLGLDPETLDNMPSFQPSTTEEERARRREATRHQEKSQFPNVLRDADASRTASPATATQARQSEARPKRTGTAKDTQTRDKTGPRLSIRRAPGQTGDAQPDPTSLKSTVTPVFWDNPLKNQPYIYNPSPIGRLASHTPAKITTTPRGGGRTHETTPRRSPDSVRPGPDRTVHRAAHVDPAVSSKQLTVPVVRSKYASTEELSKAPAASPSPPTAVLTVQIPDTHSSTLVLRISHEPRPPAGVPPSTPCVLQTGTTSSKSVVPAATRVVYRGIERYEEWHKKRADTKYLDEPELYQKLVNEGRVPGGMHRPPKVIELNKGTKRENLFDPSTESLKSTSPSLKSSKTSPTGSTESLASRHSSKGRRSPTVRPTASDKVMQKDYSNRPSRRDAAKLTADASQSRVKPSSVLVQRTSPSAGERGSVKQVRPLPGKGVSSTPFPTTSPKDSTHDSSSLKRAKKPWDGSTRAEERSEVSPRRSTESVADSSSPLGDSRTRAPLTSHRADVEACRSGVRASDSSSVGTASLTKSSHRGSLGKPQGSRPSLTESFRTVDSQKFSHKSSSPNGTTQSSQPEGARKRIRTLSTTAIVSDAPVLAMPIDDWPSPQDLISEMSSASVVSSRLQAASLIPTAASRGDMLQADLAASSKDQQLGERAVLSIATEKVGSFPSMHKVVLASSSQADKVAATTSDTSLQQASRRSSGVSYLTVNEPSSKDQDPATPPARLRAPTTRQLAPHSPLLHRCFESILTDGNTCSVVSDNFDPDTYPLGYDFRAPLPSIPGQVVSARPEVIPLGLDLQTFTRGRIEPVWPALKGAPVDFQPATRPVATVKEVRFTESSSEESLLEHTASTARRSARLTIFPNASTVTISTSSGSGSSLGAIPLPSSMEWPVPPTSIPQKAKEVVEDPPSYNDSVPTRKRTQSDATDKKDRLLLNARLPAPYIDSLIRTREANMASASAQSQRDAEQNGRTRKPSTFKKILGQFRAPFSFKKKKEEDGQGELALSRSMSAQPRAGPSTIHWKSQATRK